MTFSEVAHSAPREMRAKLIDDKPAIAILGPHDGQEQEGLAATVAGSLASNGYTVIVFGHGDTATNAARAARGQGGTVCLVTQQDEAPEDSPGEGQTYVIRPSMLQCIEAVLDHADALVILPGDLHALTALLQIWSYGTTDDGPYRPLILLGDTWPAMVKALSKAAGLDRQQRAMVTFASAADEAVETLRYYIAP